MSAHNHNWTEELRQSSRDFEQHFGSLNETELNVKASPDQWSIGQNIDHLITINESYFPLMEKLRAGEMKLSWVAKIPFLVRLFGNEIYKASKEDRRRKIKTFPVWEPSQSNIPGDIVQRFVQHQQKLIGLIEDSQDLVEKGTIIHSPANANIVYRIDRAFDIIVVHERRHFEQAKEVDEWRKNNG